MATIISVALCFSIQFNSFDQSPPHNCREKINMNKSVDIAIVLLLCSALAIAQEKKDAGKAAPTADNVIDLVGGPMSKVFEKLGPPDTVGVGDPGQVWLEYASFSMLIEKGNKTVACA